MPLLVGFEEGVARRAESLPDLIGPRLANRTDRLPLGLEPLDLLDACLPLGRLGDRLSLLADRLLARQVGRPLLLAMLQVFAPFGEEGVARGVEPVPQFLFLGTRRGTDRLPLGLQGLDGLRGLHPVGRGRQRLDLLAQRLLAGSIGRLVLGDLGEVNVTAGAHGVGGRLEPGPEDLGLTAWRRRHLLPLHLGFT